MVISEGQSQLCREDKATWGHLPSYLSEAKERRGGTSRLRRDETGWSFHRAISAKTRGQGDSETSPLLPERSEGKEGWHVSAQPRRDETGWSLNAKNTDININRAYFPFHPFICTLYASCIHRSLVQILQNEMDESTNSKRAKKGTQKQCHHI